MYIGSRVHQQQGRLEEVGASLSAEWQQLLSEASACSRCPRMACSQKVLSDGNGPLGAKVMFVGEAPGRLGAEQSLIPFHGDRAGDNFETLITLAGFSRADVFVTNAALCNPRDEQGLNATPTDQELRNCSQFLARQIEVVNPEIVVTLGARALAALDLLAPHGLALGSAVRTVHKWNGRKLIPLYHPGQRAMVHRSFAVQTADYYFLRDQVRRASKSSRTPALRSIREDILAAAERILAELGEVSYFALHKALYLSDIEEIKACGTRLTTATYLRQKDGPYCVDISLGRLKAELPLQIIKDNTRILLKLKQSPNMGLFDIREPLPPAIAAAVNRIRGKSDDEVKRLAYFTSPMKDFLRLERRGFSCLNKPLLTEFGPPRRATAAPS